MKGNICSLHSFFFFLVELFFPHFSTKSNVLCILSRHFFFESRKYSGFNLGLNQSLFLPVHALALTKSLCCLLIFLHRQPCATFTSLLWLQNTYTGKVRTLPTHATNYSVCNISIYRMQYMYSICFFFFYLQYIHCCVLFSLVLLFLHPTNMYILYLGRCLQLDAVKKRENGGFI